MWLYAAWLSALFSCISTIFSKKSLEEADSDVETMLHSLIVTAFAWMIAAFTGSVSGLPDISFRSMFFLILSGLTNGFCWLFLYKAMSLGPADVTTAMEKSSIVITVLAGIFFFHENSFMAGKLICLAAIFSGLLLMFLKGESRSGGMGLSFFAYGMLAALFAALNTIFSKIGVRDVSSNLATAINTLVVLLLTVGIVLARKKLSGAFGLSRPTYRAILLSGIGTGACWCVYYYAIKYGHMSIVVPINKMSLPLLVFYAHLFRKEKLGKREMAGLLMVTAGTLAICFFQ